MDTIEDIWTRIYSGQAEVGFSAHRKGVKGTYIKIRR